MAQLSEARLSVPATAPGKREGQISEDLSLWVRVAVAVGYGFVAEDREALGGTQESRGESWRGAAQKRCHDSDESPKGRTSLKCIFNVAGPVHLSGQRQSVVTIALACNFCRSSRRHCCWAGASTSANVAS